MERWPYAERSASETAEPYDGVELGEAMTTVNTTSLGVAPKPDTIREAVRTWVRATWDPERSLVEWRHELAVAGWAAPSWPRRWYGQDLPTWSDDVVRQELLASGAVGMPIGSAVTLAAPTILAHGPDSLRERFLLPILTGEETWCQLFSEPAAGSDLAGLLTRAELDGEEWVIDGQKVWNTSAHHADFGMLMARTDWGVPKHQGLTYFILPMHQPGVEVRPLRQMNNHASFNEVFLSGARIPRSFVVGAVGDGWRAALTTLAFERRFGAIPPPRHTRTHGRTVSEALLESEEHFKTYKWYPQRAGRVDLVIDRARNTGTNTNPVVRQEIARLICLHRASGYTADRAHAARALGRTPGPEGSIGKLATSLIARQAAKVHSMISGAHGLLTGPDSPMDGVIAEILISVPAQSIAGGTDEIQRNILGEKALDLPREPSVDRDRPFRDIPHNG
jgi:alkylation response protein AidB-like acyl-CoA dehydrogenase